MLSRLYADKIHVNVRGKDAPILAVATLNILPQEFVVILGHNGSGKSTLIKVLSGERRLTSGHVYIDHKILAKMPAAQRATELITLTQRAEDRLFSELTLEENIKLWESRFPLAARLSSKEVIEFTSNSKRFSKYLTQQISTTSGGEKQMLLLALALAHPPRILFLDEHTSALDPRASNEVMVTTAAAIKEHKITAIMVTHSLEDALKYGDRLIILNEGSIVFDRKKSANLSIGDLKEMMDMRPIH